jgi:hypothetical protein
MGFGRGVCLDFPVATNGDCDFYRGDGDDYTVQYNKHDEKE